MKSHKNETMTDRASLIGQEDLSNRLQYPPESTKDKSFSHRVSTGVAELDEILHGGLIPRRAYLVRGDPGCGKTTLGAHFLCAGAKRKEATLFISLGESQDQVYADAASIGLDMKNVAFLDLSADSRFFIEMESYDLLDPIGSEAESYSQKIVRQIEMLKPQRVFLDTMTQLRILSPDTFQFRRQVLSFLNFLTDQEATVLFTSESNDVTPDEDLKAICDGIINLSSTPVGRKLSVSKFRGSGYRSGMHTMRLTEKGLELFPRLTVNTYTRHYKWEAISSGMPELDELLHGGVSRETITIVTGPTGVGKTTLGLQFMREAASRGERSLICLFEEWEEILLQRSEAINIPVRAMTLAGSLFIEQVEPLSYNADEFAYMIRKEVEEKHISIVMIDSIAGYRLSVQGDNLVSHLHGLCKYLQNVGVTVLLINEIDDVGSEFKVTDIGISYMADNIIFMRYIESQGELRKAIGILKKRLTDFDKSMREFEITRYGIKIGEPLTELRGILDRTPVWQPDSK
jgi:circadian clock protein KaiC